MKEDLLQFIWQSKLLFKQTLVATNGQAFEVLNPGVLNRDSGPDFSNARILCEGVTLAGSVEIHTRTSDWKRHGHHHDAAYDNVILHVVYENDSRTEPENRFIILELKNYLSKAMLQRYDLLMRNKATIPCEPVFSLPDTTILQNWLHRLAIERLQKKCTRLNTVLEHSAHNWEQTFYILTAKYFGQKINDAPFEWLARNLPLQVLTRHKNKLSQLEALILGCSGFLQGNFEDQYLRFLKQEYQHLKEKFSLPELDPKVWKFGRTRPSNFPTIRLIQFSAFIYQSSHLLSKIIEAPDLTELRKLYRLRHTHLINYAQLSGHHFSNVKAELGESAIDTIIINTVIPILFLYGKYHDEETLCEKALQWLEKLKPERNSVTSYFSQNGIPNTSALHSQAIIEMKTTYCHNKKCLQCSIGNHILLHS